MLPAVLLTVGSAIIFYIIIGYPLLLAWSRRAAPVVAKDLTFQPTVSVILAVYNGQDFIRAKLESLLACSYPRDLMEILVVSDGSTDNTDAVAATFADRGVRLIRVPHGGKPAALNAAIQQVSGEILFCTDVRQLIDPAAVSHLVANFADPRVGAATGQVRNLKPDRSGEQADMELYWRYEMWARERHSRIDSTLVTAGCMYALRRRLAEPIRADTLTDDAVIPLCVLFRGYRVIFDPEALAFDYPTAVGAEFRRRLRTLGGLWQVHFRLPQLYQRANRMRFHFFSHKSSRLLLPWAVLLVWAATMALPASPFQRFLLVDELALIALALLDRVVPKRFPLKRLSSPAKTFLAMNLAAVLALTVFILPPERLWRLTRVKMRG